MNVVDLQSLLEAHDDGQFIDVAAFNSHQFGTTRITGISPYWEMHPETDEFFYVFEGVLEVTLLHEDKSELKKIPAGSVSVVPKGIWHKPGAPEGAAFLYFTPGQTLHSDSNDPRSESNA